MRPLVFFIAACSLAACSSTKKTSGSSTGKTSGEPADSVVYYKTTFDIEQKDYLPELLGTWTVQTMQRQNKLPKEALNIRFTLKEDGSYIAETGCGNVSGNYGVKGVSIKFFNADYVRLGCAATEQLNEMLRLLQNTVSLYTVAGNELTFRDNSSNIIFAANR